MEIRLHDPDEIVGQISVKNIHPCPKNKTLTCSFWGLLEPLTRGSHIRGEYGDIPVWFRFF